MALTTPSMSPAVVVREFDLTGVAPNVETSLSAFVGAFKWGPVDVPVRIQNENALSLVFGTPDRDHAVDYFSCNQFLKYSGNLIVNRQIPLHSPSDPILDSSLNAHGGLSTEKVLVKNQDDWENTDRGVNFVAKWPGALGNSLKVYYFGVEDGDSDNGNIVTQNNFLNWPMHDFFDDIPSTSSWAKNRPGTVQNDEIHVAIVDSDGLFSGTKGTVLETFPYLSVAPSAKT